MESITWRLRDKLGRRKRTAPRQPNEKKKTELQPHELSWLELIQFCGGLQSTQSIAELGRRLGLCNIDDESKDPHQYLRFRLFQIYHNLGLLERKEVQTTFEFMKRYYVDHFISDKGEKLLKELGRGTEHPFKASGSYLHQRMCASLYSSYLIQAMDNGIGFTHQHEITQDIAIKTEAGILIPDAVFKLTMNGKQFIVFLEADRATEPGMSTDMKRKSWGKTIEQYKYVIGHKLYKEAYNLPTDCGAQVHIITTVPSMQSKILFNIKRLYPQGCSYILVHTTDAFGRFYNPNTVLPILSETWERYQPNGNGIYKFL